MKMHYIETGESIFLKPTFSLFLLISYFSERVLFDLRSIRKSSIRSTLLLAYCKLYDSFIGSSYLLPFGTVIFSIAGFGFALIECCESVKDPIACSLRAKVFHLLVSYYKQISPDRFYGIFRLKMDLDSRRNCATAILQDLVYLKTGPDSEGKIEFS